MKKSSNGKRKAPPLAYDSSKKPAIDTDRAPSHKTDKEAHEDGIVLRQFYPPEMANARAMQYVKGEIRRPVEKLRDTINDTQDDRAKTKAKAAVIHWFKCDLRAYDNTALHLAAERARESDIPLICIYIVSPQDFQAHLTSPARVDFILRSLEILKKDLAALDIPLYIKTVAKRKEIPDQILELAEEWGASHIYANIEYEVDELRREALLTRKAAEKGIAFNAVPDTCVVEPGKLSAKTSGNQYAAYSPWYRAWMAYIHEHPEALELYAPPAKNPRSAREKFRYIFELEIPDAPDDKLLSDEEGRRLRSLWPAGEHEARKMLGGFIEKRIGEYETRRNIPSVNGTSMLSVHFAAGTLSARTAIKRARDMNGGCRLDTGSEGIRVWISEVAWRDFYKHVLAHWPYTCMNKPFKIEYTNIKWEYNDEHFAAWCEGRTGYPIIDAAMRQLANTAYMHNRCRMIVASFLAKDLLLDWRLGERFFMEHLIDGDFASNNGGWGFSSSSGVDPQPYFRIFNPLLQSEKFDPEGEYIRKWIPELREVKGMAIHDPCGRLEREVFEALGYPKPVVEHKFARDRALARYKEGLGRSTA
ncbi:hypothetical protein FGG08_002137 [Glutinoglossum americanum]|uniref:Photolyase/cryptochrome alpha/beta domain-containing protein n=1 Tax=Glutinoglossum americanum TaxID=1670608 RepID=A0A9P8IDG7_9PEZI|nr:hypothetical protein FGG08_002137 [Glutinoglossum americanum]